MRVMVEAAIFKALLTNRLPIGPKRHSAWTAKVRRLAHSVQIRTYFDDEEDSRVGSASSTASARSFSTSLAAVAMAQTTRNQLTALMRSARTMLRGLAGTAPLMMPTITRRTAMLAAMRPVFMGPEREVSRDMGLCGSEKRSGRRGPGGERLQWPSLLRYAPARWLDI